MSEPCWCATCRPVSFGDMRMVLCPVCGNKRCPRATDHRYACTGSNEVGQVGNAYIEQPKPQGIINGANMSPEEIEAIAQRPTCCKPFGEAVTLSRAERDALVAMAKALALAVDLLRDSSSVCGAVIRANQDNTGAVRNHQEWVDQYLATLRAAAKESP